MRLDALPKSPSGNGAGVQQAPYGESEPERVEDGSELLGEAVRQHNANLLRGFAHHRCEQIADRSRTDGELIAQPVVAYGVGP
jgi:hypothetical protein